MYLFSILISKKYVKFCERRTNRVSMFGHVNVKKHFGPYAVPEIGSSQKQLNKAKWPFTADSTVH